MAWAKVKTLAVLQARTSSTRLPGKVMKEINGKPMIYWQILRILKSTTIDELIVATSSEESDDILVDFLSKMNIAFYRGSLSNVLSRYEEIAAKLRPEIIVRLTADCPLVMPIVLDVVVTEFINSQADYASNTLIRTFADGLDIEVFSHQTLAKLGGYSLSDSEKEHVTLGIYSRPNDFALLNVRNDCEEGHLRWTVDNQADFEMVQRVYAHFEGNELSFGLDDLRGFFSNIGRRD